MVSLRISAPPGKASEARREAQVERRRTAGRGGTGGVQNVCENRNNGVLVASTNCADIFRGQATRNQTWITPLK